MNGQNPAFIERWNFRWTLATPTQDPFLLIEFDNDTSALLFDCGVRVWGKVRTILKVKHLFITHAHIDHLIGFDHIIRSLLGENKTLHIHGPEGIRDRLGAKLQGYDWDRSADQELILEINEYASGQVISQKHACNNRFRLSGSPIVKSWQGPIVEEKKFSVWAIPVDHGGSPCNSYVMVEKDQIRIDKESMDRMGVKPGPWVGKMLRAYESDELSEIEIDTGESGRMNGVLLASELVRIQRGRTVVYITDTVYRNEWINALVEVAKGADLIACESTFLEEDTALAGKYHHLTSVQAAKIALTLNAKK
ncbi:hypothetical protein K8T06_06080, partial [bacterium]|nr:hypothetical protein [bacterium]